MAKALVAILNYVAGLVLYSVVNHVMDHSKPAWLTWPGLDWKHDPSQSIELAWIC